MTRSSVLPSIALVVAMGSLFAPPVFGLMGLNAEPAVRESALLIERDDPAAVAAISGPLSRRAGGAALACPAVSTSTRAPLPPSVRTVVADLAPHTVR